LAFLNGIQEVVGSIPISSTNKINALDSLSEAFFILSKQLFFAFGFFKL